MTDKREPNQPVVDPALNEFLTRLRQRSLRAAPAPHPGTPDPVVRQLSLTADQLVDRFVSAARNAGANAIVTHTAEQTSRAVHALLAEHAATSIIAEPAAEPSSPFNRDFFAALQSHAGNHAPPKLLAAPLEDETLYAADAAITSVDGAIAETGSIILHASATASRRASLVPPLHIALLQASQIIPDLVDYFANLDTAPPPANATLVTGPSKTADIEGVLVHGMHGPRTLAIVVYDPPTQASA